MLTGKGAYWFAPGEMSKQARYPVIDFEVTRPLVICCFCVFRCFALRTRLAYNLYTHIHACICTYRHIYIYMCKER